ncbi:acetyltransferase (GNAT) family protein [Mariniflexile fucanivorans]|uniref:Acetyltransferase (GNAT) family protein n=1 Tax=Mariniflexile fucanivorans TaxID=264023 RepID=A0A4R1RG96_9FLAO|nr:GNAT family N-acetyltransferase [Mariniflexile fucanivorans]TCL65028.1 acetyltransferase (GNAT) family protein [Mariniflexile fucanivorans]
MKYIKREQFIWNFLKGNEIPTFFKNVSLNSTIFNNPTNSSNQVENLPLVINLSLFPTFLEYKFLNEESYSTIKINNTNLSGAGIHIQPNQSLENYINKTLSTQSRKNLKKYKNRLESSFNIKYEYIYGEISDIKYHFLMAALFEMLTKRFDEKNMESVFLINWEVYTKNLFHLINNKKASLFVIYDNEKPISISLNYHIKSKILFSECGAFNIDYNKFGLGHIDNYILLKWCIDNQYVYLDLGNGVSDYKKKWCNSIYEFQYLIFYKKNSNISKLIIIPELIKVKTKNFLKKIGVDVYIKKLKRFWNNSNNIHTINTKTYSVEVLPISELTNYPKLIEITVDLNLYSFLNKPIYDFLYSNIEHIDNICVYKLENKPQEYLIKGKNAVSILKFIN